MCELCRARAEIHRLKEENKRLRELVRKGKGKSDGFYGEGKAEAYFLLVGTLVQIRGNWYMVVEQDGDCLLLECVNLLERKVEDDSC
jgi:hypothetical protein